MITYTEENALLDAVTIAQAVRKLTSKQQAALALRYAGYTQEDCGQIFGMTRASIGFIERKARATLLNILREELTHVT